MKNYIRGNILKGEPPATYINSPSGHLTGITVDILLTKNIGIKGHTITINNMVVVFDKVEIHNELFILLSFEGDPRVSIFGYEMRAVLKELDKNDIKVKLA